MLNKNRTISIMLMTMSAVTACDAPGDTGLAAPGGRARIHEELHGGPSQIAERERGYQVVSHERALDIASGPDRLQRAGVYEIVVGDDEPQRLRYVLHQSFRRGPALAELQVYDDVKASSSEFTYSDDTQALTLSFGEKPWKVASNPNGTIHADGVDYDSAEAAAQAIVEAGLINPADAGQVAVAIEVANTELADLDKKTKAGRVQVVKVAILVLQIVLLLL